MPSPLFAPVQVATIVPDATFKSIDLVKQGQAVAVIDSPSTAVASRIDFVALDAAIDHVDEKAVGGITTISQKMLQSVKTSDTDEFGVGLNKLKALAKGLDPTKLKKGGFLTKVTHMFGSAKEQLLAQYNTVEAQMDGVVAELDKTQSLHAHRIDDFTTMYNENHQYHDALEAEVNRKKAILVQVNAEVANRAATVGSDAFAAQDLAALRNRGSRLDKQINDLERAMLLAKQMAPMIIQDQDNARTLVATYSNARNITIPAWKNVFTLYVMQQEQKKGADLANGIADATEEAFRKQAEAFNTGSQEIAKVGQRALVSDETLAYTQTQMFEAFDKVAEIEQKGADARRASEPKMKALTQELVDKFVKRATSGSTAITGPR